MILLISPAKSLELEKQFPKCEYTLPVLLKQTEALFPYIKKLKAKAIGELMDISPKLADLNYDRFQSLSTPFTIDNARPALYTFDGDVYTGLDAFTMKKKDVDYAQKHLRMLSGLYGLLKPLDLIQAYRLEMGTSLKTKKAKNLYEFWGDEITNTINDELEKQNAEVLINLASQEYFSAVKPKKIKGEIVTCNFKEKKGNEYKMISFNAKKARGLMARFIIDHKIKKTNDIKAFDSENYSYNKDLSKGNDWVFTR